MVRRVLCSAWPEPTWLDSALRTTTPAPIIGAHQPIPCPGLTPHCGQPRRHPSLAHTHENPRRNHPAGRDLPMRGHKGRGDSSNDDAYCGTKIEYRTSSTPAYTDGLDLHCSTNNAPTKTWGRARLRIADNPRCTHDWCAPTNSAPGPHSALRTTTAAPIIGAYPRTIDRGPHSALRTTTAAPIIGTYLRKPGVQLRIADNCACANNRCLPTDHVAGGLVKVDTKRAISHLGKQSPKTARSSTFAKAAPTKLRTADNSWCTNYGAGPRNCGSGPGSALRTTPGAPTMGNTHKALYR